MIEKNEKNEKKLLASFLTRGVIGRKDTTFTKKLDFDIDLYKKRARLMLKTINSKMEDYRLKLTNQMPSTSIQRLLWAAEQNNLDLAGETIIDTQYAWIDDIISSIITSFPAIELESVGPYACVHLNNHNELVVSEKTLSDDEVIGIEIASIIKTASIASNCNLRLVSLLDDYNNFVSDKVFSSEERNEYIIKIADIYKKRGLILPDEKPGLDYILISEYDQLKKQDLLIAQLKESGKGNIIQKDDELWFKPTQELIDMAAIHSKSRRKEFADKGILLAQNGKPTCQALDAATYLNPINKNFLHVVILDSSMESQQDKTYTLIRALDLVKQEMHHNIFFNAKLPKEMVLFAFLFIFTQRIKKLIRDIDSFSGWNQFDPYEYNYRNYGKRILDEDYGIIEFVIKELKDTIPKNAKFKNVADVGAGPNIYPAMLIAPYIDDNGSLALLEYSNANRTYIQNLLGSNLDDQHMKIWNKFEDLMIDLGGESYKNCLKAVLKQAKVEYGDIFDLPKNKFDCITSYFVAESITTSVLQFRKAMQSLASALKKNGILIIAHMVGSEGYYAGESTHFPAVNLTIKDIEEAYRDAELKFEIKAVGDDMPAKFKAREGYKGMVVVVARKK